MSHARKRLDIEKKTIAEIKAELSFLSSIGTDELDLSCNSLGSRTVVELKEIFSAIPKSILTLDLSVNSFNKKTETELEEIFSALPNSIDWLILEANSLGEKVKALRALHAHIVKLELGYNGLGNVSVLQLKEIFSTLPTSLRTLELNHNQFRKKSIAELKQIIEAIPTSVKNLAFGFNDLFVDRTPSKQFKITTMISRFVTCDISENGKADSSLITARAEKFLASVNDQLIQENSREAYQYIRALLKSYSEKASGSQIVVGIIGLFSNHLQAHHCADVKELLANEAYSTFNEKTLNEFILALSETSSFKNINKDGELFAILRVAEELTDAIEDTQKLLPSMEKNDRSLENYYR